MSIILKGFCYFLFQIMLLLSIVFLLRGHNYPGGGFVAALIASAAVELYALSYNKLPKFIYYKSPFLVAVGLLFLTASCLSSIFFQKPLLTGIWWSFHILNDPMKFGTPLLFDIGIYLSILGSIAWIIMVLEKSKND